MFLALEVLAPIGVAVCPFRLAISVLLAVDPISRIECTISICSQAFTMYVALPPMSHIRVAIRYRIKNNPAHIPSGLPCAQPQAETGFVWGMKDFNREAVCFCRVRGLSMACHTLAQALCVLSKRRF